LVCVDRLDRASVFSFCTRAVYRCWPYTAWLSCTAWYTRLTQYSNKQRRTDFGHQRRCRLWRSDKKIWGTEEAQVTLNKCGDWLSNVLRQYPAFLLGWLAQPGVTPEKYESKPVKPNILNSCDNEALPTGWNRSSPLAARRLESGVGCTLKYWLHKKIIRIVRQRPMNLCLSFHRCAATIVRHVYALYPIGRQRAVVSRPLHRFSLQMGTNGQRASYIVTAIKYIWWNQKKNKSNENSSEMYFCNWFAELWIKWNLLRLSIEICEKLSYFLFVVLFIMW